MSGASGQGSAAATAAFASPAGLSDDARHHLSEASVQSRPKEATIWIKRHHGAEVKIKAQ